jgi:hypothetical protein
MERLSFDQWIQLAIAAGTIAAALTTLAAVLVSLWLARRRPKSDLKISVNKMQCAVGDGSPIEEIILFRVTNCGEHPVVLTAISWIAGSGKKKVAMLQVFDGYEPQLPCTISHADSYQAIVHLRNRPQWLRQFVDIMVKGDTKKALRTLRVQASTSLDETISAKPGEQFLAALRESCDRERRIAP